MVIKKPISPEDLAEMYETFPHAMEKLAGLNATSPLVADHYLVAGFLLGKGYLSPSSTVADFPEDIADLELSQPKFPIRRFMRPDAG